MLLHVQAYQAHDDMGERELRDTMQAGRGAKKRLGRSLGGTVDATTAHIATCDWISHLVEEAGDLCMEMV